ncbi:hypothetical protein YC2023_018414 [Brassica napus]
MEQRAWKLTVLNFKPDPILDQLEEKSLDVSDRPCLKWMDKMEPCVVHGQKLLYLLTSSFPASNRSRPAPLLSIPNGHKLR